MGKEKEIQKYLLEKSYYIKQRNEFSESDKNISNFGLSGLVSGFLVTAAYPPLGIGIMALISSYVVYKHSKYTNKIKKLDEKILGLEKKIIDN